MKKTDPALIKALRDYARKHPEDSYNALAATFGISTITVKRNCADLGRGKDWRRGRKHADPDAANFWKRVDKHPDGCWTWTGSLTDDGYGNVWYDGKCQGAHRVAYGLTFGPIPEGQELDHKCRVRACCNPDHLEPMTHAKNMELVRSFQAKQTGHIAAQSSRSIDTGSSIDTGEKAKSKAPFEAAHTIINEDKINPEAPSETPVSVSIEPDSSSLILNMMGEHVEAESARVAISNVHGVGEMNPRQATDKKPADLYFYDVWSPGDGIHMKILARSEYDAEDKFASVWGDELGVRPEKMDGPVDEKIAAAWLLTQERELASEFDRWKSSEEGRRYFARVAQVAERERQAEEAEEARYWEQEIEERTLRVMEEQDYLLARAQRLAAEFPRKCPTQFQQYDREPTYRFGYDDEEEHDL